MNIYTGKKLKISIKLQKDFKSLGPGTTFLIARLFTAYLSRTVRGLEAFEFLAISRPQLQRKEGHQHGWRIEVNNEASRKGIVW